MTAATNYDSHERTQKKILKPPPKKKERKKKVGILLVAFICVVGK